MQEDFHYYATYSAAFLAGYSHEESMAICYSDQFTDVCSETLLKKIDGPPNAATTQLQLELMDARTDLIGLQKITRIWSSFHFLPRDLNAKCKAGKRYRSKYRLICGPNGELVRDTVKLAKGKGLEAAGIAMHILSDTWAHQYFAGTPSFVINNTDDYFFELYDENGEWKRRPIIFHRNVTAGDDPQAVKYIRTIRQVSEYSIMNLGHGRAGHLPDYSYARYIYMPAWGKYREVVKDNPSEYYHAYCQMVYALRYLRGDVPEFELKTYDFDLVEPYKNEIFEILTKVQTDASKDWKAFGEKLSGEKIADFDASLYEAEYTIAAPASRPETAPGRYFAAAEAQKSMVTDRIFASGNWLAGISKRVDTAEVVKDNLSELAEDASNLGDSLLDEEDHSVDEVLSQSATGKGGDES